MGRGGTRGARAHHDDVPYRLIVRGCVVAAHVWIRSQSTDLMRLTGILRLPGG
ncbi:hypothetical protein GCM10009574_064500 [Streptomyces asiaticus]|uniref:Transposase n=2 Tax=Streptomyces rhizosphaericus TaxID=114699 RepID=A0ABP4D6I9_9ACTN